ncbi:MAG: hypothetical protein HYT94_03450 [Parcubacteria group bacterium]|nr:hypothetical protein [Parcubacteria group bacterium]
MTTQITQAPTLAGEETVTDFLVSLKKDIDIMEFIGGLLTNKKTKIEWESALKSVPWENLNRAALRSIALDVYKHPCGYLVLRKLLHLNILHFEDFIKMSLDWENHDFFLTQDMMFKCQEVGRYCNDSRLGREISARIANSGYPSWHAMRDSFN